MLSQRRFARSPHILCSQACHGIIHLAWQYGAMGLNSGWRMIDIDDLVYSQTGCTHHHPSLPYPPILKYHTGWSRLTRIMAPVPGRLPAHQSFPRSALFLLSAHKPALTFRIQQLGVLIPAASTTTPLLHPQIFPTKYG